MLVWKYNTHPFNNGTTGRVLHSCTQAVDFTTRRMVRSAHLALSFIRFTAQFDFAVSDRYSYDKIHTIHHDMCTTVGAVTACWYNVIHKYIFNIFTTIQLNIFKCKISNYLLFSVLCMSLSLVLLCRVVHPKPGPYRPGLSICHIDAKSFVKHGRIDDLYKELYILKEFAIIGVSESNIDSSIPNYKSWSMST